MVLDALPDGLPPTLATPSMRHPALELPFTGRSHYTKSRYPRPICDVAASL